MADEILASYVATFADENDLNKLKDDIIFEHFVNYCIVARLYPKEFDLETLSVGGSDDIGFDGVAVIVNNNIVTSPDEVDDIHKRQGGLDVTFVIVQSKNSQKFKGDQVGTVIFGLKSFFSQEPAIPENYQISNLRRIKDRIYAKALHFNRSPRLEVCFATRGNWRNPDQIQGRVNHELTELSNKSLFSELSFQFYDAERLKGAYRELRGKTIKLVQFSRHVALPEIPRVRQSFVGSLAAAEYINLISDSDGKLQKSLFYDNVRDFQGSNPVNSEIRQTLLDPNKQAALCILNNGITILARKVEPIGDKMKLTDFQIVNGCQSSHVLFQTRSRLDSGTHIIVKVVETTNQELAASVIKATNRQTEVKLEAFESLSPFHKNLEEYYRALSKAVSNPLFYERRSKQYEGSPSIKRWQVITLSAQIKAYTASALEQPQSTHRYFGEILDSNRKRMFVVGHAMEPYYLSALLLNRVEHSFRTSALPHKAKAFRYHIVFVAFKTLETTVKNSKEETWRKMIVRMADMINCLPLFKAAWSLIRSTGIETDIKRYEAVRSRPFTERLKAEVIRQSSQS